MSSPRHRAEDFLALVERARARTAQALPRLRRRRRQDLQDARGGARAAPRAASTSSSASSRRTGAPRPRRSSKGSRSCRARSIEYRGVTVEEMDVDAVLARKPDGRRRRRAGAHQRARRRATASATRTCVELLDAGINVIAAFNVQHLESLNDIVSRNAGVQVRETVPDSFLKQADQIVNLDLAVEDLLERLKAGQDLSARQGAVGARALLRREQPVGAARAVAARGGRVARPLGAGARAARRDEPRRRRAGA